MAGFFDKLGSGVGNLEKKFLGPDYNYAKQVKTPKEIGMSSAGNMGALARDVQGLIAFTEILVAGGGKASRVKGPLGNRFYLKTGGQCTAPDGNKVDRYLYVNNKATGSIPFISDVTGSSFPEFRGLVPSSIENVGAINPVAIFGGFMQGANPKCRKINLPSDNGIRGVYVADADIANLDPCIFGGKNPVSKKTRSGCAKDGFSNMEETFLELKELMEDSKLSKHKLSNVYNLGFGFLLIYLLYSLMKKYN
tara:strand:+ start:888 stop:1640 length:753 start_codon:yes stop_codon:yes gene_type:complete